MIIPMPTTARPQQRYDHRLRHHEESRSHSKATEFRSPQEDLLIPNPFRSSVVANCSAPKIAASQTRRSKQFVFKPTRGHTYSSTSISINNGKHELARSLQMNAVRSLFGRKMDLVENNRLSGKGHSRRSNRINVAATSVCGDWEIWWTRFVPDGTAFSAGSNSLRRSGAPHSQSGQ
jgi:hypothetical protein